MAQESQDAPPEITSSGGISIPLMTAPPEGLPSDEVIRRHGELYHQLHDEEGRF